MNLLIVSTNRWDYGGAEKVLYLLLTQRNREVYSPTLIISHQGHFASMLQESNIDYEVMDFSSYPTALRDMKRFFSRSEQAYDAVLCNSSMAARVVGLLKPWHRLSVMYYAHGRRGFLSHCLLQAFSDRIAAVSRFIATSFPSSAAPGMTVIHNGIPISPPVPPGGRDDALSVLKQTLGLSGGPVVGSVGRLSRVKGYHDLVAAFPAVLSRHPQAHLLIVGDGGEREELESLAARCGISENTVFTGFQSDVAPYFSLLDIFVLPSTWQEPFGLVLIEAMAAYLPVVATSVGGVPEIVLDGETGLLVKPNRPDELAAAVNTLLDDSHRAAYMGRAGRGRAENLFNINLMVRKFEDALRSMAEPNDNPCL